MWNCDMINGNLCIWRNVVNYINTIFSCQYYTLQEVQKKLDIGSNIALTCGGVGPLASFPKCDLQK